MAWMINSSPGRTTATISSSIPLSNYALHKWRRQRTDSQLIFIAIPFFASPLVTLSIRCAPCFGWSGAHPILALVVTAVAIKEGRTAWRGQHWC